MMFWCRVEAAICSNRRVWSTDSKTFETSTAHIADRRAGLAALNPNATFVAMGSVAVVHECIPMLGAVLREVRDNNRQQETFEDFNNWTEERNGVIGGTLIFRFARFQDRNYYGCLPYGWIRNGSVYVRVSTPYEMTT
jgi:hypothetical protein